MPEEFAGEKTEPATPRRRQEAREKGEVARSVDVSSAVLLLVSFALLYLWGGRLLEMLARVQQRVLQEMGGEFTRERLVVLGWDLASILAGGLFPFLLGILAAGVAVNLLQIGFLWTLHPLRPSLNRINPISGFRRLFSMQGCVRTLMSLFKIIVIGCGGYWVLRSEWEGLHPLSVLSVPEILSYAGAMVFRASLKLALLVLILALFDYAYQRWQYEKDLRMSKLEVREELKRLEGSPEVRARRLQVQRRLARQRMLKEVERANVVITNPTELAIALRYDRETMPAPRVVAKGARKIAQRIREVALVFGVPIVERKPLAQALFKTCEVGDYVPQDLYKAVAEVLAYVYELDRAGRRQAA
jgi:flagellar biosynthetic protein FlhB